MSRTKWAAVAAAVIALGAAGCGTGAAGAGATAGGKPTSPRPEGTGPLTYDDVRTDLTTSAADAGVPENEPGFGQRVHGAPSDGPPRACAAGFKGFGSTSTPFDLVRFQALVGELRERDWQRSRERDPKARAAHGETRVVLKQRGWTLVANYLDVPEEGVITLSGFEDACMEKDGEDVDRPA
ncbi:hypothetical protein [Streptomyces sp. NPDC048462]|uniref:hypothetical protein n=1 Tax=Streptomyces sp. NPDC048462 TaxID=3365555 RepID=UPI0037207E5C